MKVLVVIDALRLGGAENVLVALAENAPAAGLDLDVVSLEGAEGPVAALRPVLERAGLRPRFLSLPSLASPRAVPALVRAIRRSAPDVVHAHLEHSSVLAPVAGVLARRPVVCTFHQLAGNLAGSEARKERLAVEVASRSARALFVSQACLDSFAERYPVRQSVRRRWQVMPNGVDLTDFVPPSAERPALMPADLAARIPPGAPVATVVAALRLPKGHDTAVAAWPAVLERVPQARLLVVGAGQTWDALHRQVDALGLADRVVFAGARTDVPDVVRASDLVVLPTWTEALPTALIEAAAAGRAVVASDVGGVPEVVRHGVTGLLVPPRDAAALAGAVAGLLGDPQRRAAMGVQGRATATARFDARTWVAALRGLYDEVTAPRGR